MTKQEAIKDIKFAKYKLEEQRIFPSLNEAFDMAIEALEQERPEIIRCKNCRHDNNCEIQFDAQAGSEFFCGSAERSEK